MPLFRLLLLMAAGWIVFRLWKALRPVSSDKPPEKIEAEQVVQCLFCKVHVPQHSAIGKDDAWFCCESHRQEFKAKEQD